MIDYRGRFVWYELVTTDVASATAFYAKVMGWGVQNASMPGQAYTFFTVGNAFAGGLMGLPEEARKMDMTPRWIGYVAVDDVDAAVDRIRRLGGAVHVPPTNLLNVSRFAIVADPQAALLALIKWLKPRTERLGEPSEPGRVGWHELLVEDCDAALDFYRRLFDWQKADAEAGQAGDTATAHHLFAVGGRTMGGIYAKPPLVPSSVWLYYVNVRDIDAAAERVRAGGGQVLDGPIELSGGAWIARCADPQGAVFGLEGRQSRPVGYFTPVSPRVTKPKPGR